MNVYHLIRETLFWENTYEEETIGIFSSKDIAKKYIPINKCNYIDKTDNYDLWQVKEEFVESVNSWVNEAEGYIRFKIVKLEMDTISEEYARQVCNSEKF